MDHNNSEDGIDIPILKQTNWSEVITRLIKVAKSLGAPDSEVEDLAQTVVTVFLAHPTKCGFNPRELPQAVSPEDGLTMFLIGILKHKRIDYFRARSRNGGFESSDSGKNWGTD